MIIDLLIAGYNKCRKMMDKLAMCRICLANDIPMRLIVNKNLQEMYEVLTKTPFVTNDGRPMLVCYICSARLHNSYKLAKSCLHSEELFQQILNTYEPSKKLEQLPCTNMFRIMHAVHMSYSGETKETHLSYSGEPYDHTEEQTVLDRQTVIHEVEVKQELITDIKSESSEKQESSCAGLIHHSHTDDNPLWIPSVDTNISVKIESCEEQGSKGDVISSDTEDETRSGNQILCKTVRVVLQRCDEDTEEEIDVVSLDTQQLLPTTQTHVRTDSLPRIPKAQDRQHTQRPVETAILRRSLRRIARKRSVPPPNKVNASRRRTRGPAHRSRRPNTHKYSQAESSDSERRFTHNDLERLRRNGIKDLFDVLKKQISATRDKERVPKIVILREAAALCRKLNQEDLEREKLRKKQHQLVTKLKNLRTMVLRYRRRRLPVNERKIWCDL